MEVLMILAPLFLVCHWQTRNKGVRTRRKMFRFCCKCVMRRIIGDERILRLVEMLLRKVCRGQTLIEGIIARQIFWYIQLCFKKRN